MEISHSCRYCWALDFFEIFNYRCFRAESAIVLIKIATIKFTSRPWTQSTVSRHKSSLSGQQVNTHAGIDVAGGGGGGGHPLLPNWNATNDKNKTKKPTVSSISASFSIFCVWYNISGVRRIFEQGGPRNLRIMKIKKNFFIQNQYVFLPKIRWRPKKKSSVRFCPFLCLNFLS